MDTGGESYGAAVACPCSAVQHHLCSLVSSVQILHCRTWPHVIVSSKADIWKSPCAETSKVEFPCSHKLVLPHTHKCSPYPAALALVSCRQKTKTSLLEMIPPKAFTITEAFGDVTRPHAGLWCRSVLPMGSIYAMGDQRHLPALLVNPYQQFSPP